MTFSSTLDNSIGFNVDSFRIIHTLTKYFQSTFIKADLAAFALGVATDGPRATPPRSLLLVVYFCTHLQLSDSPPARLRFSTALRRRI